IAEYSFLGEFDVLRYSRTDTRELDWTKPTHREALVKFLKLRRAHEEVERLNIEVRCLRTAIHDESAQMSTAISKLLHSNPPLGRELQKRWKLRSAVNSVHLFQLDEIESQSSFSGIRGHGRRIGSLVEDESSVVDCLNHPSGAFVFQVLNIF
ncbi:uncharacterized protein HD556DRAFT_1245485, partial [Suillus plorans]